MSFILAQKARLALTLWAGLFFLLLPQAALGGENDISLEPLTYRVAHGQQMLNGQLCPFTMGCSQPSNEEFKALMRQLGEAFAYKALSPAETLGMSGFSIGLEASVININQDEVYWQKAVEDKAPDDILSTFQLHLRKGLPWSFELGGAVTYMAKSEMFAVGGEVKWSFQEGYYYIPDFGVRGTINRVIGSRDFELTVGGFDVSISKAFGVTGTLSLTPYTGYSMVYIDGRSSLIDTTPGIDALRDAIDEARSGSMSYDIQSNSVVFEPVGLFVHRWFLGGRLIFGHLEFAAEIAVSDQVQTYSWHLGVDF